MGSEEFSRAVRGSGSDPVSVSNRGSLDTNDYPEGNAFDDDAGGYPISVNPAETIKEIGFTVVESEIGVEIHTTSGTVFTFPLDTNYTFDRWDVDKYVLKDPNSNTPRVGHWWAGE